MFTVLHHDPMYLSKFIFLLYSIVAVLNLYFKNFLKTKIWL